MPAAHGRIETGMLGCGQVGLIRVERTDTNLFRWTHSQTCEATMKQPSGGQDVAKGLPQTIPGRKLGDDMYNYAVYDITVYEDIYLCMIALELRYCAPGLAAVVAHHDV